jgi:hypothetical protein
VRLVVRLVVALEVMDGEGVGEAVMLGEGVLVPDTVPLPVVVEIEQLDGLMGSNHRRRLRRPLNLPTLLPKIMEAIMNVEVGLWLVVGGGHEGLWLADFFSLHQRERRGVCRGGGAPTAASTIAETAARF